MSDTKSVKSKCQGPVSLTSATENVVRRSNGYDHYGGFPRGELCSEFAAKLN